MWENPPNISSVMLLSIFTLDVDSNEYNFIKFSVQWLLGEHPWQSFRSRKFVFVYFSRKSHQKVFKQIFIITQMSAWNHHWIFGDFFCVSYGFFMSLLGESILSLFHFDSFAVKVFFVLYVNSHVLYLFNSIWNLKI